MNEADKVRFLKAIDFGSIDGLNDRLLSYYFLDKNYWAKLINGKEFFVIGRKGTGKSAIYTWLYEQQHKNGVLIENLSFKNFPFERLLRLSDDDFSKPNQYQSIWRNIILSEVAGLIVSDPVSVKNKLYEDLAQYTEQKFGKDLSDLHEKVTSSIEKSSKGILKFRPFDPTNDISSYSMADGFENVTAINKRLEKVIKEYLKTAKSRKIVIQFDQLDDNYTTYINNKSYFQCIISLFKAIYDLNIGFDYERAPIKIIAYLRSDIYYEINNYDPDSARWDDHKHFLNWAIINQTDWDNPPLLQLVNKRIAKSCPTIAGKSPFHELFNAESVGIKSENYVIDPFKYIIHRTFHRPRDIIQFCKYIQEGVKETNKLDYRTILNAEKKYSHWLLGEVANEIGPQIKHTKTLYAFLRTIGERPFTKGEFRSKFIVGRNRNIDKSPEALLRFLYRLGVILNVNIHGKKREIFSIIRNERTELDDSMKMQLHSGIIKGLHTYEYES